MDRVYPPLSVNLSQRSSLGTMILLCCVTQRINPLWPHNYQLFSCLRIVIPACFDYNDMLEYYYYMTIIYSLATGEFQD